MTITQPITPIHLKAAGQLPNTPFSRLSNASLSPTTTSNFAERWCFHPDDIDLEIVESTPQQLRAAFSSVYDPAACEIIQALHTRMHKATGRGSWPPGKQCHPNEYPHENYHAALLYIEHTDFLKHADLRREVTDEEWQTVVIDAKCWPSVQNPVRSIAEAKKIFSYDSQNPLVRIFDRPQWAEASSKQPGQPYNVFDMSSYLALEATRRAGCLYLEVFTGSNGKHNIHEKHIPIPGGTSGYAYFNNATCTDHVTSNIDTTISYSLGRITGLRTHEWGHTNNLQHEFRNPQSQHRSIMSYAQDNTPFQGYRLALPPYYVNAPNNLVEDHSWDVLRRFYGGEAAKPVTSLTPTDPNPNPNPEYNGIVVLEGKPRKILILPKDQLSGDIQGVFTYQSELLGFRLLP